MTKFEIGIMNDSYILVLVFIYAFEKLTAFRNY